MAASKVAITHVMEPVLPKTYTVLTVGGMEDRTKVYAFPLANLPSPRPGQGKFRTGAPVELAIAQRKGECLTADIPAFKFGAVALQLTDQFDAASAWIANRPRLDWTLPAAANSGRELRLHGRNLVSAAHYRTTDPARPVSYGGLLKGKTRVLARRVGGGKLVRIPVLRSSAYEAHLRLPPRLAPGQYQLFAHNGLGGVLGWSEPLAITVEAAAHWPMKRFRVDDYLGEARDVDAGIAAALKAAQANGGGIVELSADVYPITQAVVMPPRTVLRGAGPDRTVISLPAGGGPKGPWVAITGEGDFAVEDLRIQTVYAPKVIAAPTFLPQTREQAYDQPFTWSQTRARNVAVRRCRIIQAPNLSLQRRGDVDPEYGKWLREWSVTESQGFNGFNALHFKGDDLVVEDCTIYGGGSCVMLVGCTNVRLSRNTLKVGNAGHGVYAMGKLFWPADWTTNPDAGGAKIIGNYCRGILLEDNTVTSYSEHGRDLVYFIYGCEDCHVARNRIGDLQANYDAEGLAFHLWSAKWEDCQVEMTAPTAGRILDPKGVVKRECLDGAVTEIVDGRGVGQNRTILRRVGETFEIDRPWIVEPDASSVIIFTAPPPFRHMTLVDNDTFNTGANILLWGNSHDVVLDGNSSRDVGHITVWSIRLEDDQKVWGGAAFTQVLHNTLELAWLTPHTEKDLARTVGGIYNPCFRAPTARQVGYDILGLVIRDNYTARDGGITYSKHYMSPPDATIDDAGVVIERNFARDSRVGVVVEQGSHAVVRGNRSKNVQWPVSWVKRK